MPTTRVGPNEIYWEIRGGGSSNGNGNGNSSSPGRPAVLLMGLGSDIHAWERVAPVLGKSRRLLLIDNRGVGRSSKPKGPYSTSELADDALAVMDEAGFDQAHVVGISLGGAIAQEVALRHPEKVRSLTLIATFATLDNAMRETADAGASQVTRGAALDMLRTMQRMANDGVAIDLDPRAILGFLMPLVFTPKFLARERELLRRMFEASMAYGLSLEGFAGQLAAAWGHDAIDRLGTIKLPTLVVTGTADRLVPPAQSRLIHEKIPGSRYQEITGGVHGLILEGVDELNPMLSQWLAEHD